MTEEQLIQNIAKSNNLSSNYLRLVGQKAYEKMHSYNNWCKHYNDIIDDLRQQNELTKYMKKYNSKKHKNVCITKYTKKYRYRSYRQSFAIVYNTLVKELAAELAYKDECYQWEKEVNANETTN